MGYQTEFEGRIEIEPPLNPHEIAYLKRFNESRRMDREQGPYYCGTGPYGQDVEADVRNQNRPDSSQPGLWCNWAPTEDGTALEWDGAEKFYDSEEWMRYIVETFLMPGCNIQGEMADLSINDSLYPGRYYAPEFEHFTFDHVLTGTINAQGEELDDTWDLVVSNNFVKSVDRSRATADELLRDAREIALFCLGIFRQFPTGVDEMLGDGAWAQLPDWFTGEDNGRQLWNGGDG